MKPPPANPVVLSLRCAHRSSGGRRCRLSVSDPRSVFCAQHRSAQLEEEAADHFDFLSQNSQGFQTAQGINHSLGALHRLLAENRISPRRAAVLSHICGLLLRTLPQIDADKAAGIIDPTQPPAEPPSQPFTLSATDEDAGPAPESDPTPARDTHSDSDSDLVNTWDPSLPEPDPKKKPS